MLGVEVTIMIIIIIYTHAHQRKTMPLHGPVPKFLWEVEHGSEATIYYRGWFSVQLPMWQNEGCHVSSVVRVCVVRQRLDNQSGYMNEYTYGT